MMTLISLTLPLRSIRTALLILPFTTSPVAFAAKAQPAAGTGYTLEFTGGTFHGPGNMADSPLSTGRLGPLVMAGALEGRVEYFNNGAEAPNVPGEASIKATSDGRLSDGRPFNEHMDGGIAEVGRGAMRFLTVVVHGERNGGVARVYLDPDLNWHMHVDMALDPGFPEGLIVIADLDITTGRVEVPKSRQTTSGHEGGIDRAGSLTSGSAIVGRLGDYDLNGYLDGVLVGATSIPINHMFSPGSPAVQVRSFSTDIPVAARDAAYLTISSLMNFQPMLVGRDGPGSDAAGAAAKEMTTRIDSALALLESERSGAADRAGLQELRGMLERCMQATGGGDSACSQFPDAYFAKASSLSSQMAKRSSLGKQARRLHPAAQVTVAHADGLATDPSSSIKWSRQQ